METLCYFPNCFSISSRKLFLTHQLSPTNLEFYGDSPRKHFYVRASSTKKPRRSRKLSDAELCNDIREFVATVGLPEDHIPSTKELLQHGRRSRLWSTVLWLYPGIYEMKFVVDGQWRTNTQMESITRGHICNNILRVDR